jgi:hypothetical protein
MEIARYYPMTRSYAYRCTNDTFDKSREMYNDPVLTNRYHTWKEGINPRTNRKIKIGGKTYNTIKNDFMVSFNSHGTWCSMFYLTLMEIDQEKYTKETNQLNHETDKANEIISSTIEQINRLERWYDYVELDGIKYGLPNVLNEVHREDDCFGKMEFNREKDYVCRGCRYGQVRYRCIRHTFTINKCNKCGYEEKHA